MKVKKLKSINIGTHHFEEAVILSDKGEIFVTMDELTSDGYKLLRFQTYSLEVLTTIINNLLRGVTVANKVKAKLENSSIAVSPVANLYEVESDLTTNVLTQIVGGYESQIITIISKLGSLEINSQKNIQLNQTFTITNPYSTLLLQKMGEKWIVLSNNINK